MQKKMFIFPVGNHVNPVCSPGDSWEVFYYAAGDEGLRCCWSWVYHEHPGASRYCGVELVVEWY